MTDEGPGYFERLKILHYCREKCKGLQWEIPKDFMTFQHFERVVNELEWNSSPGVPYCYQFTTNRILFAVKDGIPSQERLMMVWNMVQDRLSEKDSDPIRLFVKPEPHKKSKLDKKAYRLISSVSVVDQIIDHMLFDHMNKKTLDNWWNNPVKVGWSPVVGGWKAIPTDYISTDKTSWDWTVGMWLIELVFELRKSLCLTKGDLYDKWLELAIFRFTKLFYDFEFVTSGGYKLRYKGHGIMKSGCVNTLVDNSLMQLILHVMVSFKLGKPPVNIMSMGDDVIMEFIEYLTEYLEEMKKHCIIKEVNFQTEFAGLRYKKRGVIEPLYRGKHAYQLLHMPEKFKNEIAASYSLLYHRSTHRDWIRQLLESIGCELPPLYELDAIFDGEC